MNVLDAAKKAKQAAELDIPTTISGFREAIDALNVGLEESTEVALAQLIGDHGVDGAARLIDSARGLKASLRDLGRD